MMIAIRKLTVALHHLLRTVVEQETTTFDLLLIAAAVMMMPMDTIITRRIPPLVTKPSTIPIIPAGNTNGTSLEPTVNGVQTETIAYSGKQYWINDNIEIGTFAAAYR